MIKKTIVLVLFCILFFTSCSLIGFIGDVLEKRDIEISSEKTEELMKVMAKKIDFGINEDEVTNAMAEKIVLAINENDKEAFRALFSNKTLGGIEDFDSDFEKITNLIEGEIISWERDGTCSSSSTKDGKKKIDVNSWFFVKTETDIYRFFLSDYTVNTFDLDDQGLTSFQVIKDIDTVKEEEYGQNYWIDWSFRGIIVNEREKEKND